MPRPGSTQTNASIRTADLAPAAAPPILGRIRVPIATACLLFAGLVGAQTVIVPAAAHGVVRLVDLDAGAVSSSLVVSGDAYGLPTQPDDITFEDELAVASFGNNRVQFFARGGDGNLAPTRSIEGAATQINQPNGVAFSDTELFVGNHGGQSILVFPRNAEGNVAPTRVIAGSNTGLGLVTHMRVFGNELFVASYGAAFRVFDTAAGGNVAPKRVLPAMVGAYGIAVDDGELFLSRHPDTGDQTIYVYAREAEGGTSPLRTIQGVGMNFPSGLALAGDELIVTEYFNNVVRVFDRNTQGSSSGLRQFNDPNGLSNPVDVWYRDGEIYVAARATNGVRVYALDAQGEVAPLRVITGAATGLDQPIALIDSAAPLQPDRVFRDSFEG